MADEVRRKMKIRFKTEIREVFEKPYLKVFLVDQDMIEPIQGEIEKLSEVDHANVTLSQSRGC